MLQCEHCLKVFRRKDNLAVHLHTRCPFNPDVVRPQLQCDVCGKIYGSREGLRAHRIGKHEEKKFHCQSCPKNFTRRCNLTRHVRRHVAKQEKSHQKTDTEQPAPPAPEPSLPALAPEEQPAAAVQPEDDAEYIVSLQDMEMEDYIFADLFNFSIL